MAASQSILEILIQAVDESGAALEGVQNNLKEVSQNALSTGMQVGVMAAAVDAAYGSVVYAAANVQESQDSLKQSVVDALKAAGTSTGAYTTQVSFLQDKINGYKASIAEATATLDTHTGSVEKSAAAHAKAAASIATDQLNIAKYQAQLDILKNSQDLQGESVDDLTSKLESQANANVSLGFSLSDSTNSLKQAFTATKSVSEAMQVNQAAMDLARAKNLDLATATNQVILAMNGQGRALATYGIQIKDGLSGMAALQAVQGAVNGQAQAYSDTLNGQLSVAMATFNKLLADMGTTQLPMLTQLLEVLVKTIDAVDNWTQKHQELTRIILIAIGALGAFLTILATLLIVVGTVGLAISMLGAPILALIAVVVVLTTIIATNWDSIAAKTEQVWNVITAFLTPTWNSVKGLFNTSLTDVKNAWNSAWTDMSDFLSNIWTTIWNTVKSGINNVISALNGMINALDSIHISIPAIQIPGTKIGTPALNLGFNIPDIPMLAAGGVVYNPMLAMIGEQGPEAVVPLSSFGGGFGGGQTIQIFIQGGYYLDQSAATQIGNTLAKQIVSQLRVRNYAS
jgi:hypothetical protein